MTPEECMDTLCKYKIGDRVALKSQQWLLDNVPKMKGWPEERIDIPQLLEVIGRTVEQCYGGIQVQYAVRGHGLENEFRRSVGSTKDKLFLAEIELMPFPTIPAPPTEEKKV